MQKYQYSGKTLDGKPVSGVINAIDSTDLESKLMNQGVFVLEYGPASSRLRQTIIHFFKQTEITRITRQMSLLLSSEVAILEVLELIREQINDRTLKQMFDDINKQIEAGRSVADAFGAYPVVFDTSYVSTIRAGESSGRLGLAFDRVATYREKSEEVTKKIRSALAYPLLVVFVAVLVILALVIYIVPVFSSMYENFGAELPVLTQKVVGVSNFFRETIGYWLGLVFLLIITIPLLSLSARVKYIWHKSLTRIPLIGSLVVRVITARFSRTMGSLLSSGVDIIYALEIASKSTGNTYVETKLQPAQNQLAEGKSFTGVIEETNIFPKAMLRLTASGEKTGRLGEMLTRTADFYEKETDNQITTVTSLVEPIIILILGIFIAFILMAMYLPLFDLVQVV